jgi:hypothetical protein
MALNLVSPGVKVREVDLTNGRIDTSSEQVGAIVGPFERGPVGEPVLIESEKDLLEVFGKPRTQDGQREYWMSASNYLSYGGVLRVVRAGQADALQVLNCANAGVSVASTIIRIDNYEDYINNHFSDTTWFYSSRNPGSWANNLKVCTVDNFADQIITGVTTTATSVTGFTTSTTKTSVVVGVTTTVLTGVTTTGLAVGQYIGQVGGIIGAATSISGISTAAGGTITISSATLNSTQVTLNLNFGTLTSTQTGPAIQVGYAVTQTLNKTAVSGSTVVTYTGFLRGIITGIGNSEVYVKVTDRIDTDGTSYPVSYRNPGDPAANADAFSFDTTDRGETIYFRSSDGSVVTNVQNMNDVSILDWYEQQTLGLTNSTVYWKNIAPKPGTSEYAANRNSKNDEVHIVVVDDTGTVTGVSGNVVEKFTNLSKSLDGKISPSEQIYYKDYISRNSQYIFAGAAPSGRSSGLTAVSGSTTTFTPSSGTWGVTAQGVTFNCSGATTYSLTGGTDYNNGINNFSLSVGEIINAHEIFNNPAEYQIDYLIAGPSSGANIYESQSKANALIAIAEERKDCIALVSPHKADVVNITNSSTQTNNIIRFFDSLTSSSYAVFDSGYKYTYDRFNNDFVYIPCNSDIAGLMARTSERSYPWYSPAGSARGSLNNVVKLAYNPSQSQRDELYTRRINPIIASPGAGFILFGDKTALSYASAFDRINVRRLFLTVEKAIERAARAQLFEFNDLITRTNFVNIVEPYLRDVKAKRGITEFVVICDETNNTPDVIDSNQLRADIFIKPARSINFIGLTFVATRTGVSFEEVVGTV